MSTRRRQQSVDTPVRCFYADDPTRRPDCSLTATVRLGVIALCPPCQARASTIGKGEAPVALHGTALDVLDWLQTADEQLTHAERVLASAVTRARQAGHSWAAIGLRLNITRQAAQQRFRTPTPPPTTRASAGESTTPPTRAH